MKKLSKKNMILLIIVLLLILILGSTFAYFGWSSTSNDKDLLVDVTVSGNDNSCSKASDNNKLLIPTSSREKGRIITMTAKQTIASNAKITWDLTVNRINKTETTTSGLKSSAFKYELVNSTTGVSYGSGNFENIANGSKISFSTNNETIDYNREYTFTLYLWIDGTLGTNPIDMSNQTYNFDINCNITGTDNKIYPPTGAGNIEKLYDESEKTLVTNNNIDYNYAPSVSLMNDRLGGTTTSLDGGNIRYYGANPNNYIYFNCDDYSNQASDTCELWRIIGVFDGKVKIIRNESIGTYSWDNKNTSTGAESNYGKNDWTTARLMKLLNPSNYYTVDENDNGYGQSLYWNSESGKCFGGQNNEITSCDFTSTGIKNDVTRNMISEVAWKLGGWNTSEIYSNQIYDYERGIKVYTGRPTSWTGKIALMYPSDYGYATDFTKCTQTLNNYSNNADSYACRENDWLFNSSFQWLLTQHSGSFNYAWSVDSSGYVHDSYSSIYYARVVRPTLYLSSKTIIESGNAGTSTDPFRISAG